MNRRHRIPWLVLAALLAGATAASAQSPFALSNIGQPMVSGDARMVARGFGLTVTDTLHPGFKNLASLANLQHVAVAFTGYGEKTTSEDSLASRVTYRTFTPDLRVALPLVKGRLAFSAGFVIDRSTNYQTDVPREWSAWEDTLIGDERFVRDGSIFEVPLGAGLRLAPWLALGGSVNLVRGNLTESLGEFYIFPAGPFGQPFYQPSGRVEEDKYYGTSTTYSFLFSPFGGGLRIAGSYTPAYDVRIERTVNLNGVSAKSESELSMTMPVTIQAGCELGLGRRWRVGGDAWLQRFSAYEGHADWEADMIDEYRISAGIERARGTVRRGGISNLPVRLGAAYKRWGYEVGGEPVHETSFSAGTGFPFGRDMGQLDVALTWGKIGDLGTNGYRSDLWRLTVSVTGLEAWW